MYPIEINLTPDQVRKIVAKFLGIEPGHSKVEFNISDVSDRGGPNYQLTSIKVKTDDLKLWGFIPQLKDL